MPPADENEEREKPAELEQEQNTEVTDSKIAETVDEINKSAIENREGSTISQFDQFGNAIKSTNRPEPIRSTSVREGDQSIEKTHSFYASGFASQFTKPAEMKVEHGADGSSSYVIEGADGEAAVRTTVKPIEAGGKIIESSSRQDGEMTVVCDQKGNLTEFIRKTGNIELIFRPGEKAENALRINGQSATELPADKVQAAINLISASTGNLALSLGLDITIPKMELAANGQDGNSSLISTAPGDSSVAGLQKLFNIMDLANKSPELKTAPDKQEGRLEWTDGKPDTKRPEKPPEKVEEAAAEKPVDKPDLRALEQPAGSPEAKASEKPQAKPDSQEPLLTRAASPELSRIFQSISSELSPEFVRALATGDAAAIRTLAESNPQMARAAANGIAERITGGPPDANTTRLLEALAPLADHMSPENAARIASSMPTIRGIMFPHRGDNARVEAFDRAANNIFSGMLGSSNTDIQKAALQHFSASTSTWYGADRERVFDQILPLLNSTDNSVNDLARQALARGFENDGRLIQRALNTNDNPDAQITALDYMATHRSSSHENFQDDITRLAGSQNPELREQAIALLLVNRGRGDSSSLPAVLSNQLSQMTADQVQEFVGRSLQGGQAQDFMRGLQELMSSTAGTNTESGNMRRNLTTAILHLVQNNREQSPELLAQMGRTILAAPEGAQLLRQSAVDSAGRGGDNTALAILMNAAAGNDSAAREAQNAILSIINAGNRQSSITDLLRPESKPATEINPGIARLLNPDPAAVSNSVRDSLFRAAQNRPELLSLATAAALGQDRVSTGSPQEQITSLTDAAATGNQQALRLLSMMARQVNGETAQDSPNRMALNGLLNLATRADLQNRDGIDQAVLSLSNRSPYLQEQVMQGLANSGGDRTRAVAVMAAIATGESQVSTNPSQAISRLPDLIRQGTDYIHARQAAQVLALATQLRGGETENAIATQARESLSQLLGGLQNNAEGRQTLTRLLDAGLNLDAQTSSSFFRQLGRSLSDQTLRGQAVEHLRSQLRNSPANEHAQQERIAESLSALLEGYRPLRPGVNEDRDSNNHNTRYLGEPPADLLSRAREGDHRAQLELQTYGLEAIRHLRPENAADRQIFAQIAARHLEQVAQIANFPLATRDPLRQDPSVQDEWHFLMNSFARRPHALSSMGELRNWQETQMQLQGLLVQSLRQRAQGTQPDAAIAALAQLIPPPAPDQLVSNMMTRHENMRDAALGRAAREALIGLANTPERQTQVFDQLMQALGRNWRNTEVLRAACELGARTQNLPADRLNTLNQYISATLTETERATGSISASQRRYDALAGAAALLAAGHQVAPEVISAGRTLVGNIASGFQNGRDLSRTSMQYMIDSMTALAPFMTAEQARALLESPQARALSAARVVDQNGNDVSTDRYGRLFLRPNERLTTEPGPLQQGFGNLVRSLARSSNPETQQAALQYASENFNVATANLSVSERQAFLEHVQSLARSDNQGVRDAATAVLNRALDADPAFRTQMLNHNHESFRHLAVESFFRNGGNGLQAASENARSLLAIAQNDSAPAETRQHARALLLSMMADGGLPARDPAREELNRYLEGILTGQDTASRRELVNDAVFLAQQSRNSNNDSIAGLAALVRGSQSQFVREQIASDLLSAHQNNCPVRTEGDQNAAQLRLQNISRALDAIGAYPREDAPAGERSILEEQARSRDPQIRSSAIALLAYAATDISEGANPEARQRAEQALFKLVENPQSERQTLEALSALARGDGPSAQQAADALVRMALRQPQSRTSELIMNELMSLARQNLDGSGRLPASAREIIKLLEQAGIAGNTRAIETLGRISTGSEASARNALESLVRVVASRPSRGDAAAQTAESYLSSINPDRMALISQAINSAFRAMPENMQNRVMDNHYLRNILTRTSVRELTGSYAGDGNTLRTIAGVLSGGRRFASNQEAISYLANSAAGGNNLEALSLLIAAASRSNGSDESREINRLASARLAELAGVNLGPTDRNAPDGGFTATINALHQRALAGNPEAMRILIQSAADPSVAPNLRQLSMEAMRETLRSPHANQAVDQILSAWRSNPSTSMLGVLAAASAQLPNRTDLQRQVRDGYLNSIRRDEGLPEEQYRLRCQTAALALLSNPGSLTPELTRELASHMTPEMAQMLMAAEHVPADRMRQLLTNLRAIANNPPEGTNIAAVAQAMGNLARIATPQDLSALAGLRERASGSPETIAAVDRALFNTATQARDLAVRAAAFQNFENSQAYRLLSEPMQRALREFATTGQCNNLAELRNACDRIMGTGSQYPLAVSMSMYMNVLRPDGTLVPAAGRPSDRELCQMADRIMSRFEYGDSRSISGYVLPVMAAAFDRYGGINGRAPDQAMLAAVMQNLASDGRLTDARFRDLETVDRNENVRNWQIHRSQIMDEINAIMQEMQRTGSNLLQSHENHQRLMDAYNRARERNNRWDALDRPPPLPPRPSEQDLRDDQGRIITQHQQMINRLADLYGRLGRADGWLEQAHLQRTPAEYNELRTQGRHVEASTLLLQRWGEGRLPAALESELGRSWQQLYQNGLVPHAEPPQLNTASQAYDYLARMRQSGMEPAIANALAERCLRVIRQGEFSPEAQRQLESTAQQFQARSQALLNAFGAIVALGRRDETLSNFVRNEMTELRNMLNSSETQQLRTNLNTALEHMQAQLNGMERGSPGYQALQLQISQMQTLNNMLDPNGDYVRNLDTLERGLREITPDSWGQTLASTFAHVAVATAMFAAATAVSVATFGAGTPAAVAACLVLTPILLTAGSQVTQETLHRLGASNQSTPFMDYVVGRTHFDPHSRSFVPVGSGDAWGQLGQQFAQEAIMNTLTLGMGSLGRAAMGRVLSRAGYALPHAAPALAGSWAQRAGTAFRQNYTLGAHGIGLGLAAPGLASENLAHAMMVVGPLFAFGHSAYGTYRGAVRIATPQRPSITRPAELIDHLNLGNMNEQQRTQLREWWGSRPAQEQARIAEAFRFIPPGEDARVMQALRSASTEQISRLTEGLRQNRSPAHSSAFLREFANLPAAERSQLLSTLDGLSSTQRNNLLTRLSEAATINHHADSTPGAALAGNPMSRLVSDIVNAGPNRAALVDRIVSLPAPLVAEIANLPVQALRARAIETLSSANRASTFSNIMEGIPAQQRPEFLRSLTMIENAQTRAQVIDRLSGHANAQDIAAAIGAMPANRRNVLEALGSIPSEKAIAFMSVLGSGGDRQARTSLLQAIANLPNESQRTQAIEAIIQGGNQQWARMSRLNDLQMRQELNSMIRPQETAQAPAPRPEPRPITPEQQNFVNAVSGDARAARQRLVDQANELNIDLPLSRLGSISQQNLAQLNSLLSRARELHNGPLPGGISESQRTSMLQGIESMLARSGGRSGIDFRQVAGTMQALDAILGPRNSGFTNLQAGHLADVLAASRNVPPELFPPFEQLMHASPQGLARYRNLLEQLNGLNPPRSGPDVAAWQATQRIQQLLAGSDLGRDWAFLPAARGGLADQSGIDGVFVNLRTGAVRPVDFKTNNQTGGWIMNIANPGQTLNGPNGAEFVRNFLNNTTGYNLSAAFMNEVGLPPLGRPGGAANPAADLQGLNSYMQRLHDYMAREQAAGRPPSAELRQLALRMENARPTLHGASMLRARVTDLLSPELLAGEPRYGREGTSNYIEYRLPAEFHANYSGRRADGSPHAQNQHIDTIRIYQDGRVEGRGGGHTWELGNARDIYQNAITQLQSQPQSPAIQAQIQNLQNALGRFNDRHTFVRPLQLSGGSPEGPPRGSSDNPQPQPGSANDRLSRLQQQVRQEQLRSARDPEAILSERQTLNQERQQLQQRKTELERLTRPNAEEQAELARINRDLEQNRGRLEILRRESIQSLNNRLEPLRQQLREQMPGLEREITATQAEYNRVMGEHFNQKNAAMLERAQARERGDTAAEQAANRRIEELDAQRTQLEQQHRVRLRELTDLREAANGILANGPQNNQQAGNSSTSNPAPFNKEAFSRAVNDARLLDIGLQSERGQMPATRDGSSAYYMRTARDIPIEVRGRVSQQQAMEVLERIGGSIVKPARIEIMNDPSFPYQGMAQNNGRFSTVKLNFTDGESRLLVYDHELGHLLDFNQIRNNPQLSARIRDTYNRDLARAGLDERTIQALRDHDYVSPEAREAARYGMEGASHNQRHRAYVNSRDEIAAEAFKLFMQERQMRPGERPSSYRELVERFVSDPDRQQAMLRFEETYNALKREVFEPVYQQEMTRRISSATDALQASGEQGRALAARLNRLTPEERTDAGIDSLLRGRNPSHEQLETRVRYAELVSRELSGLPSELQDRVRGFLGDPKRLAANDPKLRMLEDLVAISRNNTAELPARLRQALDTCANFEQALAAYPQVPSIEQVFTPQEQARIREIQEAQQRLPAVNLSPEQLSTLSAQMYQHFSSQVPGGTPTRGRQLHIVLGPPGSGKSSAVANHLGRETGAIVPDADHIKPRIPGYTAELNGQPYAGLGNQAVHPASTQVTESVLHTAMSNGDNIVLQTVGRSPEGVLQTIMRARALGYEVHLHDVTIPPAESARRTFTRSQLPPDEQGIRQVIPPRYVLDQVGHRPEAVFDRIVTNMPWLLSSWTQVDNNVPRGEAPRLIRSSGTPLYPVHRR